MRTLGRAIATFALTLHLASPARAAASASPDQVDAAIARGIAYLLTRPAFVKNGNWETTPTRVGDDYEPAQWGGRTALCTYALLAAGVSPNDPRLRPAIQFLRTADLIGYYAIGLRAQVWLYLPQTTDNRAAVARDARLLLKGLKRDGSRSDSGLFDYVAIDRERIDLSVSQYGVLGLWACAQLDAEIPGGGGASNVWRLIDSRWRTLQDKATGSWSYGGNGPGTASITAAGVATLFITQDYLGAADASAASTVNPRVPEIDKGLEFLAAEFPKMLGGGDVPYRHYAMYGIERVGVASGRKYFGTLDWYRAGADYLVGTQDASAGSWHGEFDDDVTSAFAMLFLARGREPVMMNKLKFDAVDRGGASVEALWNARARDVANVTRFVARRSERGLNWQAVDLGVGNIRDLHDAPIAYLAVANARTLKLPTPAVAMLREYVEQGGMLVLDVEQNARVPTTSSATPPKVLALDAIFAGSGYVLRPLPADHPIFTREQFKATNWTPWPIVWGLSNGVRELAIVLADDPSRAWQANATARSREAFELMANVYQYAIDKDHAQPKGRTYVVTDEGNAPALANVVRLARLKYEGNWDPEPGGWRRLQAIERRDHQLDLRIETVDLQTASLDGFTVAHLTGTSATTFPPRALTTLKRFVDHGGLLIIDAAGGSGAFAASVEQQLDRIAGPAAKGGGAVIEATDPLYSRADGKPFRARYRSLALASIGSLSTPRLRGVRVADRWGVIYSSDDLSAGLVGNEVDGIRGYTPDVATDLMDRIVRSEGGKHP